MKGFEKMNFTKETLIEEIKRIDGVIEITAEPNTKYHVDAENEGTNGEGPAVILVIPTC